MRTTDWAGIVELQGNKFGEIGTPGLEIYSGYVRQAYNAELYWPSCAALYDRIWRSDPEVAVARLVLNSLASKLDISVVTDEIGRASCRERV